MGDRQDEKLEAMLRSRRMPPSSPDLVERIILRARKITQNPTLPLTERIKQLFMEFHLRRPAYVFAATLIFGFVVGLNTPVDTARDYSASPQIQTFLDPDEELL